MAPVRGAIKRGAALCQFLVFGDHRDAVKLLGEIISVFSPQNGSSTETGVWTRRDSNPHLHFDREPCYPLQPPSIQTSERDVAAVGCPLIELRN